MVELASVDRQVFQNCVEGQLLRVGGSKLMASRLGEKLIEIGFRTSFLPCFPFIIILL